MNRKSNPLGWNLLLAAILCGMAVAMWAATEQINYEWRWKRVPQYFAYQAETEQRAPDVGEISSIRRSGDTAQVQLRLVDGSWHDVEVDAGTLTLAEGASVARGDVIGVHSEWMAGPLTRGLWVTIWISFVSGVIGLVLGIITGLCRISKNPTLRGLSLIYVEVIRGTPLLVQIFIFYFFIGTVLDLDRIVAGIGALALFTGAYVAEIIRAGIQSIARGQTEAARSLGMTGGQAMRYIVLPQAIKRTLPPLAGTFISLVKDSSLVSVIAITDLTKSGREVITSTFATFEIWFTVALLYLLITSIMSQGVFWLERRLARSD